VLTYGSPDKHLGGVTYGGYSDSIIVDEDYVVSIPSNLDLAATAPLLCAGITTYSPMRHWGVSEGKKVGIVGLGGLGHMGVKFAHALGAHTVVFTTSSSVSRLRGHAAGTLARNAASCGSSLIAQSRRMDSSRSRNRHGRASALAANTNLGAKKCKNGSWETATWKYLPLASAAWA
jgi:D-arabinose 1-dehydrogenase-like Zn-dependent alcohol dehydrogenase